MAKDQASTPKKPLVTKPAMKVREPLPERIKNWFKGVRSELRKVTWPTRKELINYTLIVIAMTLILAVFIGLFDFFFQKLFFHWL